MKAFRKGFLDGWMDGCTCMRENGRKVILFLLLQPCIAKRKRTRCWGFMESSETKKEGSLIQFMGYRSCCSWAVLRTTVGWVKKTFTERLLHLRHCTGHFKTLFNPLNNYLRRCYLLEVEHKLFNYGNQQILKYCIYSSINSLNSAYLSSKLTVSLNQVFSLGSQIVGYGKNN